MGEEAPETGAGKGGIGCGVDGWIEPAPLTLALKYVCTYLPCYPEIHGYYSIQFNSIPFNSIPFNFNFQFQCD